jgi:hypothetical protein
MSTTRPSGYSPFEPESLVTQEVAQIDERGRLNLLPRWLRPIEWLAEVKTSEVEVLMVFAEPGLISLRNMNTDGQRVRIRYDELKDDVSETGLELVRLLQDRYGVLRIAKDARAYLGNPALVHLGCSIARREGATVYVASYPNQLDIMSCDFRNKRLVARAAELQDLP